ncbi:hypothetical protein FEM48_Zijuj05G0176500 [Ziziphus jujuba var. spinosa]|uniref:Disease resistance protein RPS4B/Roq1-like leucine-rich repeats domain-containing protein n=1 Tax=Ziziphus jujuba var. spinosa TaxID=714518 RepID=A0A978VG76_ZIZJJ|nr:hypothetical protein FEM48_Zijuj05G0176500 [Ziziphus jujuba var. spinosa]
MLKLPEQRTLYLNATSFNKMKRLRLLIFDNVVLSTAIGYLSNELRLIDLPGYQFPTLPFNSGPKQLVVLNMPHNHIHQFDKGFKSVGFLTKLVILDAQRCSNLSTVPSNLVSKYFTTLDFQGCSRLQIFPNIVEKIKFISSLNLSGTAIKELPSSIDHIVGLHELHLSACRKLVHIPSSIYKLVFLDVLNLTSCTSLSEFPNYVQEIHGNFELSKLYLQNSNITKEDFLVTPFSFPLLQHLDLSGNRFATLPSARKVSKLSYLRLANCKLLREIPELPECQINLEASDCKSLVETSWKTMTKIISNDTGFLRDSEIKVTLPGSDIPTGLAIRSLRRGNVLVEPGNMWLIYLPASTLLSECLPYSPFKDTKKNELMIEQKRIKVSEPISHIIERTYDDFANGGIQFSWSSRQKGAGLWGRKNMFEIEDWEEKEEVANISETEKIIDRTFDDFANEGNQFSWSSQQKSTSVSARTNIFEIEDSEEKEKVTNISETADMEVAEVTSSEELANIFETEDMEEDEELANISETKDMENSLPKKFFAGKFPIIKKELLSTLVMENQKHPVIGRGIFNLWR